MKTLLAISVGMLSLLIGRASWAQNGHMMNRSTWGAGMMDGEYGGIWVLVLLVIVVAALVAFIVKRGGK